MKRSVCRRYCGIITPSAPSHNHQCLVSKCYSDFTGQPGFHGPNGVICHGGRRGGEREEGRPCSPAMSKGKKGEGYIGGAGWVGGQGGGGDVGGLLSSHIPKL